WATRDGLCAILLQSGSSFGDRRTPMNSVGRPPGSANTRGPRPLAVIMEDMLEGRHPLDKDAAMESIATVAAHGITQAARELLWRKEYYTEWKPLEGELEKGTATGKALFRALADIVTRRVSDARHDALRRQTVASVLMDVWTVRNPEAERNTVIAKVRPRELL